MSVRPRLPLARPWIGPEEIAAVARVLRSGWLTTGPTVTSFERAFAAEVGAPHAVAVNSCTGALHAALLGLGVGPGDEVITTTLTFVATAHACLYVGATPRLVDIDPVSWNIDPAAAAAAVTPRTKAILPVDFAGVPCDYDALHAIAAPRGIAILEDAAHALGAVYRGRKIGTIATATAFSFYATKNLTTGEGGMLTTADAELADRVRQAIYFGIQKARHDRYRVGAPHAYEVTSLGFKYNMDSMHAALGLVQLGRLARANARRARLAGELRQGLATVDEVRFQAIAPDVRSSHHLCPVLLDVDRLTIDRDDFVAKLAAQGIGASVHYIPVHQQPYYRKLTGGAFGDFPVADDVARRIVSLPLSPQMTPADVARVARGVRDVVRRYRRRVPSRRRPRIEFTP